MDKLKIENTDSEDTLNEVNLESLDIREKNIPDKETENQIDEVENLESSEEKLEETTEDSEPDLKEESEDSLSEAERVTKSSKQKKSQKKGFNNFLKTHKLILFLTFLLILIVGSFLTIYFTDLKYPVIGAFAKADAEIVVSDSKTLLPLENASVTVNSKVFKTDKDGKAHLAGIPLSKSTTISIDTEGYLPISRQESFFIGQNNLLPFLLDEKNRSLSVTVVNSITSLPIESANVEIGDNKLTSDASGMVIVSKIPFSLTSINVKATKENFLDNSQDFKLELLDNVLTVKLTPVGKDYFLSNRSGKIDLYQSNLDGTGQGIMLAATGNEDNQTSINISTNGKWVALSSTREAVRGGNNSLIPILYVINTEKKTFTKVKTDVYFQIYGWSDDNLIFLTYNNNSAETPTQKLISYNVKDIKQSVLLTSNSYLNSGVLSGNAFIYSFIDKTKESYGLYSAEISSGKISQISKEGVYQIYFTSVNTVVFSTIDSDKWYSYDISTKKIKELSVPPVQSGYKSYFKSSNKVAFIETRDGKTELFTEDLDGKNEKKLTNKGGVTVPIRWVNDEYIVYRVVNSNETANYAISVNGGTPVKISDVYSYSNGGGY